MAGIFGNQVAKTVRQGIARINVSTWSPIHSGIVQGLSELEGRQWIKIQPRGNNNIRLALKYVTKNADGTFTAPTSTAHDAIVYPATSIIEEPIADNIRVYGRAVQNGGSAGGFKVIAVEYA